jgi:hypothetical protein
VAAPFVPVVAVLPLAVAPAGLTVAVTATPLWLTALPLTSCSCTTGCGTTATPLGALPDGRVVNTSFVAAPALTLNGVLVAAVSSVELATRV